METITVIYVPLLTLPNGETYYHKTYLYKDSSGKTYFARAEPETQKEGDLPLQASRLTKTQLGGDSWGRIATSSGVYDSKAIDWPKPGVYYDEELILAGSDLSSDFQGIKDTYQEIASENRTYRPLTSNSNTAADEVARRRNLPVPAWGDYGDHWSPGSGGFVPNDAGDPASGMPWPGSDPFPGGSAPANWGPFGDLLKWFEPVEAAKRTPRQFSSPIVLDLDGDGVETQSLTGSEVYFDLNGDGFAELTGWVGSDDGFLALDKDANGKIDTGRELFGSETLLQNGQKASNGYLALAELDDNHDGKVDSLDAAWGQLVVWKDSNQDGISDSGELTSLALAGVASISSQYSDSALVDAQGNAHRQISTFTWASGATGATADVWFRRDMARTVDTQSISLSTAVRALPDAWGTGTISNLRVAMQLDTSGSLQGLVEAFAAEDDILQRTKLVQEILYKWAGVEQIDIDSRGGYGYDARRLFVLEKFMGEGYLGVYQLDYYTADPNNRSVYYLNEAFIQLQERIYAQLMSQTHLKAAYDAIYFNSDSSSEALTAVVDDALLELLVRDGDEWVVSTDLVSEFARTIRGFGFHDSVLSIENLKDALLPLGVEYQQVVDEALGYDVFIGANQVVRLGGGNTMDVLAFDSNGNPSEWAAVVRPFLAFGSSYGDTLTGGTGNDFLYGLGGGDTIVGQDGDDLIYGGDGNDYLAGQGGNDTYVFSGNFGADVVDEFANTELNKVIFTDASVVPGGVEVAQSDISVTLLISGTSNSVVLFDWRGNAQGAIQQVVFADGTIWLAEHITDLSFQGTAGDDMIYADSGHHTISGKGGNDWLIGTSSADTLDGGAGTDLLEGGSGGDIYVFGVGYGTDEISENSTSGTDVIRVKANGGVAPNVIVWRDESLSLHVSLGGTQDDLVVTGFFANAACQVEKIEMEGGATWLLSDLLAAPFRGTSGSDQLYGTTGNDRIEGLDGADFLYADLGNDTLDGGAGDDLLSGDGGNDVYLFGLGGGQDTIIESAGTDTIKFTGGLTEGNIKVSRDDYNYVFSIVGTNDRITVQSWFDGSANRIESVQFDNGVTWNSATINAKTTTASQYADFYWGTASANTYDGLAGDDEIYGFAGNDTLTGSDGNDYIDGGEGNDVLNGGAGDDTFVIDSASDSVTEASGQGIDTVKSTVAWTLGANVENLTLLDLGGAISATGNELDNVLVGNSSDNTLTGGAGADQLFGNAGNDTLDGGAGADSLVGGAGNDTYVADDAGDAVVELAAGGSDTVQSSITYTLGDNVEKLTLTGAAAINGTGNSLNNTLTGNSAANTLTGGAGNDSLNGGAGADTLVGGTGDDTYTVDNAGDVVTELAGEGVDTVRSSVAYTLGSTLENLTLTGSGNIAGTGNTTDNVLTGNAGNNTLTGLGGADVLDGGAGSDTLVGGTGDDIYVVDATTDVITEQAGEGTDTVQTTVTLTTLAANVENLTLLELGGAINGTGNTLDNVITGNTAINTLNGGAGADTLIGGQGDDIYVVDAGDTVIELDGEGTDTVQSAISWTLGANLEKLTLTGSAVVNATGNDLANTLTGNSAANVLTGGLGDDIYIVRAGDTVVESANEGIDTVQSSLTYTLTANVEKLTLTGSSAINGTGNELDNTLTGNSGVNTLTGGLGNDTLNGGTGADSLVGGQGDDTYVVDNTGDAVTESAGEGTDTVQSSITYTLGANVENLTLTGSTALNGTGNELNNLLTGNSGVNTLTGGAGNDTLNGGAGADSLVGGTGDDLYVVDNASDTITENASEGIDTVQSSITFSLASYANVENVTLTGASALNATGNAADNVLTGNSGANTLTGGEGNDTYRAGAGTDTLSDTSTMSNDVYTWGRGEGADTLTDAGGVDRLDILAGAAADQIWLRHVGNNLEVSVIGTSDKFTISGWYTAAANQVESLKLADGRALQAANVQTLVDAMAAFSPPAAGQTTLPSNYDTALSSVIAANWA
jgi:Ca2+-binding RTX toxin-like protein